MFDNYKDYDIRTLPKDNWHYLWETYAGNNYKARKGRAEKLLDLAYNLGIGVMETNIREGKEKLVKNFKAGPGEALNIGLFKSIIDGLQKLPQKRIIKKRSVFLWVKVFFLSIYVLFYICYFWAYMIVKNKILLGGRRR